MPERRNLPVLTTGASVIFPGPPVTLAVVRTAAMRAIEAAMRDDHMVFTVAELDGGEQLRVEDSRRSASSRG